jgi:hypothetical protein
MRIAVGKFVLACLAVFCPTVPTGTAVAQCPTGFCPTGQFAPSFQSFPQGVGFGMPMQTFAPWGAGGFVTDPFGLPGTQFRCRVICYPVGQPITPFQQPMQLPGTFGTGSAPPVVWDSSMGGIPTFMRGNNINLSFTRSGW